jgi:hypothetical protein
VAAPKTAKPASASHAEPVSKVEQIGRPLNRPNTPNAAGPQVDDCGESDFDYFLARPNATTRTRLPFENEFPPAVMEMARGRSMFVHVVMMRDLVTNEPTTRGRGVFFSDSGGGTA